MKRLFATLFIVATALLQLQSRDFTHYVNPMVGTDFTGNTYPGAQMPFGMVQLSPDNLIGGWDRIAGYFYPDSTITGFSHTHLDGTGAGDMYDISFFPVTLPYKESLEPSVVSGAAGAPLGIYSTFSHDEEQASAGYYHVRLADYDIDVTLTATPRCGIQRYIFPNNDKERVVILNLSRTMNWDGTVDSFLEQTDSVSFHGYRFSSGWARDQRVYFATRFSRAPERVEIDSTATASSGKGIVARFYFGKGNVDVEGDDESNALEIYTALSGTGIKGAERNLEAEAPTNNFPLFLQLARNEWNLHLGVIEADTSNKERARKFYTALYHSMLAPTIYSDVDGAYLGPDRYIHQTKGTHYSTFSLWDTYRAAHPLFTITNPDRVGDMVQSLVDFGNQHGRLPVWNMWGCETDMMIGYHSVPVIADAYLKGFSGFDPEEALDICLKTAHDKDYRSIGKYIETGYVPTGVDDMGGNDDWALSRTLEYAYDDWCIAALANELRNRTTQGYTFLDENKDAAQRKRLNGIIREFESRAKNYENVFDYDRGFMVPRNADGTFQADFNPDAYGPHICESNGWMYLWNVQHDIDGLCRLLGGKKKMLKRLEEFFTHVEEGTEDRPLFSTGMIGQYAHGNEPSHHTAYLFNYLNKPSLCQKYVAQICRELYKDTPDGLCGNEDCGQTSAWFVFSALGFYPVNPVGGVYEIGTPYLAEYTINLESGKQVKMKANNLDDTHIYVKNVKINGMNYPFSFITDDMLQHDLTIEFVMSDKPCKKWWGKNRLKDQQLFLYGTWGL